MATCFSCKIRDARPADAPFLARCIAAGMHFYDFEEEASGAAVHAGLDDIIRRLTECETRDDLLYSYSRTRVAEVEGMAVGCCAMASVGESEWDTPGSRLPRTAIVPT